METINLIFIFVLGLIVGSFLNVCIYRIPKSESIVLPASNCLNCKINIKFYDLIPVISYILLKGKCRNCKEKISVVYPITELITGISFLILYMNFGFTMEMYIYSLLVCILIIISIIDVVTNYVYFLISLAGVFLGIIFILYNYLNGELILGYILGGMLAGGIIFIFAFLRIMGWGDIEVAFLCGLFLGVESSILMIIIAILIGGFIGSIILLFNKINRKEIKTMPFVPFISTGCFISLIYGEKLVNVFLNYYGIY